MLSNLCHKDSQRFAQSFTKGLRCQATLYTLYILEVLINEGTVNLKTF